MPNGGGHGIPGSNPLAIVGITGVPLMDVALALAVPLVLALVVPKIKARIVVR